MLSVDWNVKSMKNDRKQENIVVNLTLRNGRFVPKVFNALSML